MKGERVEGRPREKKSDNVTINKEEEEIIKMFFHGTARRKLK